jgi:hydrogenase-4 component B
LIKTGIYGLVRMLTVLGPPEAWWGPTLLLLGGVSAVLGVANALGQHDIKRLLAYHSIENIGIIVLGLGLGLTAWHTGRPEWAWLGLAGGLLHVWNHGLFKALLFLGAGAVIHATGERALDRLGGLAKRLPATSALFLVGAVAICGLPPLNGFVSEWLIYVGAFHTAGAQSPAPLALAGLVVPALALTGALAVACFVKVFGVVFLGEPRTPAAATAHEPGASMLVPMFVLGAACAAIGVVPWAVAGPLEAAAGVVLGPSAAAALPAGGLAAAAGLDTLSLVAAALLIGLGFAWLLWGRRRAPAGVAEAVTWDCGYAAPTARMQYTATSFARTLVDLFGWALRPERHGPGPMPVFPTAAGFVVHARDFMLDGLLRPAWEAAGRAVERIRVLQRGPVQLYVLYVLVAVIVLLVWALAGGGEVP